MDSIFGIGIPELLLILVIAGLILGPKQIQSVARNLGRFVGMVRNMSTDLRDIARALSTELDTIDEVKAAKQDLVFLQSNLAALQRDLDDARREFLKQSVESKPGTASADKPTPAQPTANRYPENGNTILPPELVASQDLLDEGTEAEDDGVQDEGTERNSAEFTLPNLVPVPDDEP
jgi:Sec-independent protein translocase protein TatA